MYMTLLNYDGRMFGVINIIDLFLMLFGIAVFSAIASYIFSDVLTGVLTIIVGISSLATLIFLSQRRYGLTREEIQDRIRSTRPSAKSIRRWITEAGEAGSVVLNLRTTVIFGPIFLAVSRIDQSDSEEST